MAIITNIVKTNKSKGQLYELFIDNESVGYYLLETIVKHNLKVGREVELQEVIDALNQTSIILATEKVLNLISKSMKSKNEILKYLKDKGYNIDVSNAVISKLEEYKYINDETYSKYYVASLSKKYGNKKIKFELLKKGISDNVVAAVLSENIENTDVVKELANKYLKNKILNYKTKTKLFSHLVSKGFEYDTINSVINKYNWSNENEDWV